MTTQLLPYLFLLPAAIYALLTLVCADRFFRRPAPKGDYLPPVTIIKPVKGGDPEAYENFASFCRQDYPAFQLVFAIAAADDPAVPLIRRLQAEYPEIAPELVVDPTVHGPNLKVSNLINAWPCVRHDILLITDSDVRVGPGYLRATVAPFADPGVGLVTNLYRTAGVDALPGAIEALGFTTEMIPNVLVARQLEGLSFALGASMACRREALEAIGGFGVLADLLADDYQLGNRIALAGWRLELSPEFVACFSRGESLGQVLSRQLRWCRTMRVSRPGGYLSSGITQPFWGVLALFLTADCSVAAMGGVMALYLLRSLVTLRFSRVYVRDYLLPRYLWLLPLRDALSSATWALSFLGRRVSWRGTRYDLLPGGRIVRLG
jgi:ceramide glucosyltransferase